MKIITIPKNEIRIFWNILKRHQGCGKVGVMFKNQFAIFASRGYSQEMLSYSCHYDGPEESGVYNFYPLLSKIDSNDAIFSFPETGLRAHLTLSVECQQIGLYNQLGFEFPEVMDDGVETPANMPAIFSRMFKVKRSTYKHNCDRLFVGKPYADADSCSYAIMTDGPGMMLSKFPCISPSELSIPIFPMKVLPGEGLISLLTDKEGKRIFCYQVGGWLYTAPVGNGLFATNETPGHELLSPQSPFSPIIRIDKGDLKAMIAPVAICHNVLKWKRILPHYTIRTTMLKGILKITATLSYESGRTFGGEITPPIILNKTKWLKGIAPEFTVHLLELKNAMSAKFTDFAVNVEEEGGITLRSENKGMFYVGRCRQ